MKKDKTEKKENKFIQIIKKKWLINGTSTIALIAIILAAFIALNVFVQNLDLAPIDLSQEQLYSLTDESKEKVKSIDKDVNIYFVGYSEDESTVDLAKQYKNANNKIKTEVVTAESRPDLVNKYGIENGSTGIIIECGEKSKVLTSNDLYTYDMTTSDTVSIAEEKLTSSIMTVASSKIPKIYFLQGYSDTYSLTYNMNYLNIYLANEVNEVESLNILSQGKVPDDCDTLVICSPTKDFDEIATNAIIDYINSGRNILWLNSALTKAEDFPNVNKVLALYGVNPFEVGTILESDTSKMLSRTPYIIYPEVQYSSITKNISNSTGVLFVNPTKINFVNSDKLEELKVEKNDLLKASEKSFFRNNFSIQTTSKTEADESGEFVVGAELIKTIKAEDQEANTQAVKSKMVIFGDNNFISDYPIGNSNTPIFVLEHNKDLILNSMAYLVDRQEDITARKSTGTVTYTATEEQNTIIQIVIFAVPIIIIITGIVVWIIRRRKK